MTATATNAGRDPKHTIGAGGCRADGSDERAGVGDAGAVGAGGGGDFDWLLARWVAWIAWIGVAVALFMPENGFPFGFCVVHRSFGIPCPTCGMTRSVSHFLHGRWFESWRHHPMGWMAATALLTSAATLLWPEHWKSAARRFLRQRQRAAWRTLGALLGVWLTYGAVRMVWVGLRDTQWP